MTEHGTTPGSAWSVEYVRYGMTKRWYAIGPLRKTQQEAERDTERSATLERDAALGRDFRELVKRWRRSQFTEGFRNETSDLMALARRVDQEADT